MSTAASSSRHRMAFTVWVAVLPTLTLLQFALEAPLRSVPAYLRPPIMATLAVPIVIYILLPPLQRLTARWARPASSPSGPADVHGKDMTTPPYA